MLLEVLHELDNGVGDDWLLLSDYLLEEWIVRLLHDCLILPHEQLHLFELLGSGFVVALVEGFELCDDVVVVPCDVLLEFVQVSVVVL